MTTKSEATKASAGRKTIVRVANLIANSDDSHAEIAAKVGVDKSLVTRWRSGERKPTAAQLAKLEELYGERATPTPPEGAPPFPDEDEEDSERAEEEDDDETGNHDRLRRYIRDGIRELQRDKKISGVKRAEALKKLCDAQVSLDKSTGENALTLARIVAHPEFKRVVAKITEGIGTCPACLRRAIDVLEAAAG